MTPLAYFLTFRTYGTWLPGDPRGHHGRGSPRQPHSPPLHAASWDALVGPPILLDARARAVVEAAVRDHARHAGWAVHALNVRTNHVHIVVSGTAPPERIMGQLKAWATRRLREGGLVGQETRPWVQHGSTRYLWKWEAVEAACRYVSEGQGELAGVAGCGGRAR